MTDDAAARDLAIKRLRQKQGFRGMLAAYVVVNLFLWAIWAIGDDHSGVPWPLWVTLGWGVGVGFAAWSIYGQRPITEADVEKEMRRTRGTIDPDR